MRGIEVSGEPLKPPTVKLLSSRQAGKTTETNPNSPNRTNNQGGPGPTRCDNLEVRSGPMKKVIPEDWIKVRFNHNNVEERQVVL